MPCWICHTGDGLDAGICPRCADAGYEEHCASGCYTDPAGVLRECDRHAGARQEAEYEAYLDQFYGASTPQTIDEQCQAAAAEKRRLR